MISLRRTLPIGCHGWVSVTGEAASPSPEPGRKPQWHERPSTALDLRENYFFLRGGLVSLPSLNISMRLAPGLDMPLPTPTSGFESGGW